MNSPVTEPAGSSNRAPVLRNTLLLVGAHVVVIPLSMLVYAVMGRKLGPSDFGLINLAMNLCGFAFMIVEWGHGGVVPRAIAQNQQRSGILLGTSLASRTGLSALAVIALSAMSWVLYPPSFLPLILLIALQSYLGSVSAAYQDAARGFERTDVTAYGRIVGQLIIAAVVLPVLFMGGDVITVTIASVAASAIILPSVISRTHKIGVGKPSFDRDELLYLTRQGWAFLVSSAALTSLGFIDTLTLSKLSGPEVFGWHSAAQKLIGTLLVPSTALIAALYPTLSRLISEDQEQFQSTLRRSIVNTGLVAIPLALGCALYADLGVSIYGKAGYAPVGQNLVVLAAMVLLVYFSMPLSSALLACGRHVAWSTAQILCVGIRLVLNLLLIPVFEQRFGNGGLGVCVSAVACEIVLVITALCLLPAGVINQQLLKELGKGTVAGLSMVATALILRTVNSWVAAPLALVSYCIVLYLVGGVDKVYIHRLIANLRSKLARNRVA